MLNVHFFKPSKSQGIPFSGVNLVLIALLPPLFLLALPPPLHAAIRAPSTPSAAQPYPQRGQ